MPTFCPHCHKMVAEQPKCAACGKPLRVTAMPRPGQPDTVQLDRAALLDLIRYSLAWLLPVVGLAIVCMGALYLFLT